MGRGRPVFERGRAGQKLGWRGREGAWLKLSEENR